EGHVTLPLEPALAERLEPWEREQLARAAGSGRRALRVDFAPSPEHVRHGHTITSIRVRLSELGEIVKVVPRAAPSSTEAPGGLVFTIFLLSGASTDEIAAAAGVSVDSVHELLSKPAERSQGRPEIDEAEIGEDPSVRGRAGVLRV